jgi:hypothetical protein
MYSRKKSISWLASSSTSLLFCPISPGESLPGELSKFYVQLFDASVLTLNFFLGQSPYGAASNFSPMQGVGQEY